MGAVTREARRLVCDDEHATPQAAITLFGHAIPTNLQYHQFTSDPLFETLRGRDHYITRTGIAYPKEGSTFVLTSKGIVGEYEDPHGMRAMLPLSYIPVSEIRGRRNVGLVFDIEAIETISSGTERFLVILPEPGTIKVLHNLPTYFNSSGVLDEATGIPLLNPQRPNLRISEPDVRTLFVAPNIQYVGVILRDGFSSSGGVIASFKFDDVQWVVKLDGYHEDVQSIQSSIERLRRANDAMLGMVDHVPDDVWLTVRELLESGIAVVADRDRLKVVKQPKK